MMSNLNQVKDKKWGMKKEIKETGEPKKMSSGKNDMVLLKLLIDLLLKDFVDIRAFSNVSITCTLNENKMKQKVHFIFQN